MSDLTITEQTSRIVISNTGFGDMKKATYDTNSNGIVDNAELVNGHQVNQDLQTTDDVVFNSVQTPLLKLTGGTGTQGEMTWNADEETVDIIQNGATLQLGQEVQVHCRNNTSSQISNGTVVMATGALGASGRITVAPATTTEAKYVIGIATEDIADGTDGKITIFGKVRGIDTSSWEDGTILYLGTNGSLTSTEPTSGLKMPIAIVINSHHINGTIMVRVTPIDENLYVTTDSPQTLPLPLEADKILTNNGTTPYWTDTPTNLELNGGYF